MSSSSSEAPAGVAIRSVAAFGGIFTTSAGLWAMIQPQSFFEALAKFDPYNQHLIQDIGAFQIGLGAVLLLAVFYRPPDVLVVALVGSGVGSVAHVVSHFIGRDLGGNPSVDIPAFTVIAGLLLGAGLYRMTQLRN